MSSSLMIIIFPWGHASRAQTEGKALGFADESQLMRMTDVPLTTLACSRHHTPPLLRLALLPSANATSYGYNSNLTLWCRELLRTKEVVQIGPNLAKPWRP